MFNIINKINTNNLIQRTLSNVNKINCKSILYKQFHDNNITSKLKGKIIGKTKHYVPANKEWKNSIYLYNKNDLKIIPVKHNIVSKLIKNHFNINALKKIARSRRMRSRIIRSSSRRIFLSNPEIKQNSDKTVITLYVFNREKQFYIRKLFYFNRRSALYNSWIKNYLQKRIRSSNLTRKRKILFKKKTNKIKTKRFIPYYGINYKNETDFFRYKLLRFCNKFLQLDKFIIYLFITHVLSLFNIKLITSINNENNSITNILNKKPNAILWIDNKSNNLKIINKHYINENIIKKIIHESKLNKILKDRVLLNNVLWEFIEKNLIIAGNISIVNINYLYKLFIYKKYKEIIYKFFKRGARLFYNFGKLQINKLKFTSLLSVLKTLIARIYNKNIELNIVNLKYLHLNSDIYTQAIALKIKKRKSLLKVLRKSLKLVKVPFEFHHSKKKPNMNNLIDINTYKSLEINKISKDYISRPISNDWLNNLLQRFFPNSIIHGINVPVKKIDTYYTNNKVIDILDSVKFKWVTGLRLEAAGRLTRRNTASRSVFKFRHKGNLENKQHYMDLGVLKIMPPIMLRNIMKVNTQYTLTKSKKRIGSFGIKSWISGY